VPTPRFPAIAICPGDSFLVADSLSQLEAASPAALRSGYFDRLYLLDSDGKRWRVARFAITSARPKGPFGKLVGVELAFASPDVPLLSKIADALCQLVDCDPDDLYQQCATRDELKARFRASTTTSDLIAAAASRRA
jgi:hypothetical protein